MSLQNNNGFNPFGGQSGQSDPYGGMYNPNVKVTKEVTNTEVPVEQDPELPEGFTSIPAPTTGPTTLPGTMDEFFKDDKPVSTETSAVDTQSVPVDTQGVPVSTESVPVDMQGISPNTQSAPDPTEPAPTVPKAEEKSLGDVLVEQSVKVDPKAHVIESDNKPEQIHPIDPDHLPTQEQKKIMLENDISNGVIAIIGNSEEYQQAMEEEFVSDPRERDEKIKDPSDYILKGAAAVNHGFFTQNQIMLTRMIRELIEQNKELTAAVKELRLARISPNSYLKKAENGVVDGKMAGLAVIAATQGTFRVILYNSGFNITLRPITIEMASEFINSVDRDFQELGRILGGFFHLPMAVYLKQKLAEFLPKLIINSNFVNWKDTSALLNNISYHDYDTLLWALGSMLYKEGIGIGVLCCNKDCRNSEESHFIDLAKSCYLNLDKLKGEAVSWIMATSVQRTEEDLKHYREDILGNVRKYTPEGSSVTYVMKDPSLSSFINHGCDIIGKLADAVNDAEEPILEDDDSEIVREKEIANRRERQRLIGIQMYRMLIPWLDHLEVLDKASNQTIMVRGYEAIEASLEQKANVHSNLYNELEDFIKASKVSFYCTSYIQCPKCGKRIDFKTNDLTPIDLEYLFFFLSCLFLEQAGVES